MNLVLRERAHEGGDGRDVHHDEIERVDLVVGGTHITIADAPGKAAHLTMVGPDGHPIVDVTIREGPSGETNH